MQPLYMSWCCKACWVMARNGRPSLSKIAAKLHEDCWPSFILNPRAKTERAITKNADENEDDQTAEEEIAGPNHAFACQCKLRERAFAAKSSAFCQQLFTMRIQTKRIEILIRWSITHYLIFTRLSEISCTCQPNESAPSYWQEGQTLGLLF